MNKEVLDYFNGNELAANVWQDKYAQEGEKTPDDMHRRMAKEFARIEEQHIETDKDFMKESLRYELSIYGKKRNPLTEESIYEFFKDFKYIVPQGSIMSQLGSKSIGSLSNCFVIGQPYDSYGGILQKDQELVQLMKRRGGVGLDLSTLRPNTTPTSNAAKSSTGPISFMPRFSNSTREVAQDGRRGALMLSIHINHPDSLDFIKVKRDLTQVTGANISVKLSNEFMEAVDKDDWYDLRFPVNVPPELSDTFKLIRAKEYWNELITSAHSVAEPGIIFEDNHHNYSPDGVYPQFRGVTTNPCGEIFMQPYDACRLIAINLFSFVGNPFTEKAYFDYRKFYRVAYEAMRLSDDIVQLELEHIQKILNKIEQDPEPYMIKELEFDLWKKVFITAKASRRTGLGFTALADTLAALGHSYDGFVGLTLTKKIMRVKMEAALDCTTDMAITRGTFEGWNRDTEFSFSRLQTLKGKNSFYQFIANEFPGQAKRMFKHGRRNVSWSTVAPTGTVSLLTQTSSGLEPMFLPYYIRRKKVNPGQNVRVDFTDQNGDTWQEFPVLHPKFKDWLFIEGDFNGGTPTSQKVFNEWVAGLTKEQLTGYFEDSPWYGSTANDIDWLKRVEMQSIIQKYTTHSISSTINLPNNVSEQEVSDIYMAAWKQGLKGITVYRDGSRSGVLVSETEKFSFEYNDAVKRPKELLCHIYATTSAGSKYNVVVGILDNKPYEVFITEYFTSETTLVIRKVKRGRYDLLKNGETYSESITSEMTEEQEAITRLVSTSLRHGADIKFIVEQLNKTSSDNMFSFTKSLARVLKKYIPDGVKASVSCNDCGSIQVIFEEGCAKCLDCGSSKCG